MTTVPAGRRHESVVVPLPGAAPFNDQFVDEVLVDRAVSDLHLHRALTPAEKALVARKLFARGFGRATICSRLGVAHRDVKLWLDGPDS